MFEGASINYADAIQSRIDDLLLTKAVRHDAVRMCGLIVSSDRDFFWRLGPEETRRFFEESKAFLTNFVGQENVLSAMVHVDEKTPHMHFLHVPVKREGRLSANSIYTRDSLKMLQTEFHRYLHSKGFDLQRGVEQEPGSKKKHLATREFKQQQEALNELRAEGIKLTKDVLSLIGEMGLRRDKEAALEERLQSYEAQAQKAETILHEGADIPEASMFSFKPALAKARQVIALQNKALAAKGILTAQNKKQQAEIQSLRETITALTTKNERLEAAREEDRKRSGASIMQLSNANQNLTARLEEAEKFFRWNPEADKMYLSYVQEQRQEAQRKAAEQKRREAELARAKEAQQVERERVQSFERRPHCMGMGR